MRSTRLAPLFLLCLAACASDGMRPGWTGDGAEPLKAKEVQYSAVATTARKSG